MNDKVASLAVDAAATHTIREETGAGSDESVALYVHLPFTPALDFSCHELAVVTHNESDLTNYVRALTAEIELVASDSAPKRKAHRVVIGGPCPNYFSDINFATLLSTLACSFDFAENSPTAVHLDPRRSSRVQLELLRGLGVTEINLEVRDVDPHVQAAVGMTQSIGLIEDAISMARNLNFRSVNMDLSFGLPLQTSHSIKETVRIIHELSPDMVSCQQFTRRPELFPHQRGMDAYGDLNLAQKLSIFNRIVEEFNTLGWEWVGLNSFVKAEHPWIDREQYAPIGQGPNGCFIGQNVATIGFGVGAVTETVNSVSRNVPNISEWESLVASGIHPYEFVKEISIVERAGRIDLGRLLSKKSVPKDSTAVNLLSSLGLPDHCYEECDLGANVQISEAGRHWLPLVWSTNSDPALTRASVS